MTDQEYDYIRKLLQDQSAIALDADKRYLVESRLAPLLRQQSLGSIGELVQRLRVAPRDGLSTQIVEAMVTTETSFFRDLHPFETLRKTVLPELMSRRRGERCLHIWCGASASGQEPYSLAILLREHFPELRLGWKVALLATDLSQEMLERARAGRFNQIEVNRGLPAALLVRYFAQHGASWQLCDDIRNAVEFRQLNLAQPWPLLPRMDLVLIRNVMIYFDIATKKAILGRLARVLAPDGYLILGGAESTFNIDDSYRRIEPLKGGFYQRVV
jgi:chemotaxis protein methyltransferase CheR